MNGLLQGQQKATLWSRVLVCAKCVYLLSKWSCLCLKVDCRLVLSLETGALISVWLCWLSFSSISTVQQEKPCGHTFNGAPARGGESTLVNTMIWRNIITSYRKTKISYHNKDGLLQNTWTEWAHQQFKSHLHLLMIFILKEIFLMLSNNCNP